jgi:hypothetical protein
MNPSSSPSSKPALFIGSPVKCRTAIWDWMFALLIWDLVIVTIGIVIERALGRRGLGPHLERGELLEQRQVVATRGLTIFSIEAGILPETGNAGARD